MSPFGFGIRDDIYRFYVLYGCELDLITNFQPTFSKFKMNFEAQFGIQISLNNLMAIFSKFKISFKAQFGNSTHSGIYSYSGFELITNRT